MLRLAREQPPCEFRLLGQNFSSVNAKQLEHPGFQPDPSRCESGHGHFKCKVASAECGVRNEKLSRGAVAALIPQSALRIPHFQGSQGVISSARRSAKAEVRGASPRESTILMVIMM